MKNHWTTNIKIDQNILIELLVFFYLIQSHVIHSGFKLQKSEALVRNILRKQLIQLEWIAKISENMMNYDLKMQKRHVQTILLETKTM